MKLRTKFFWHQIFFFASLLLCQSALAQNVGIGTDNPEESAILELSASDKGLLIPRLTTAARVTLASTAVEGLMVYDTDLNAFYFFNGSIWAPIGSSGDNWIGNGNDMYNANSGKVGIGISTPKSTLHVNGDYYGRGHVWYHAAEGDGNSGTAYIQARDDSGTSDIDMLFRTQKAGNIVNVMRLNTDGNLISSGSAYFGGFNNIQHNLELKLPINTTATENGLILNSSNRKWRMTVGGDKTVNGAYLQFLYKNHNASSYTPITTMTHTGRLGIGETNPSHKLHVKDSRGVGQHVALIQNSNKDGSGLMIQIDGNHGMLLPVSPAIFPPKFPTPAESIIQPVLLKLKERIMDAPENGFVIKPPNIQDLLDILDEKVDTEGIGNIADDLNLDQLLRASLCDGTQLLTESVQLPPLDLSGIDALLPSNRINLPTIPEFQGFTIELPNFPNNTLLTFPLPSVSFQQVSFPLIPFQPDVSVPYGLNVSVSNKTVTVPNLDDITIPKSTFGVFNTAIGGVNTGLNSIETEINNMLNGVKGIKNELEKLDIAQLVESELGCADLPDMQEVEIKLPKFDITKVTDALDNRNHFVTFVDKEKRELGAIKAQHPADFLIEQVSTSNLLEIASIIPGIFSVDGGIVENVVALLGFGYSWVEGYNSIGVTYESGFGDYAEWLPRQDVGEVISYGDVIGIKAGMISKNLVGAEQVMVVSKAPIIMGNAPNPDSIAYGNNIAFIGQVPVKVMGAVNSGDYIVADLELAGFAKAIAPKSMATEDFKYTVGRSWDTNVSTGFKFVNTLVGMHNNAWVAPMHKMQIKVNLLEGQQAKNNQLLSTIVKRMDNLENQSSNQSLIVNNEK